MRLLVVSVAVAASLLAAAGGEPLSCVCARLQTGGGTLQLSCLQSEGENVTCTDSGTNFGNDVAAVDGSLVTDDVQSPPASRIAKRSTSCPPDESRVLAGYTYVRAVGLVKLFRVHTRYGEAKQRCQKEGGHLVNHYDRNATRALVSLLPELRKLAIAYTGVHYNRAEGRYYGSYGKSASDLPWAKGQPSRSQGDCVLLGSKGELSTAPCDRLAPFICERPFKAPRDYTWVPSAGRFLKVGKDRKTYSDAQRACQKDGATLAVPDTWRRAEAMLHYASRRAAKFYVGFTFKFINTDYITASGKRMSSMEFSNWESEDHHNAIKRKFDGCVALYSDGYYDDVDCRKKYNYLCELQP